MFEKHYSERIADQHSIQKELTMSDLDFIQHAQYLKQLNYAIREICDHHKQMQDHLQESWSKTMNLFVITDQLSISADTLKNGESKK